MKRKSFAVPLTLALVLSLLLGGAMCPGEEPVNIELDFAVWWPQPAPQADGLLKWKEALENRVADKTQHTLSITMHYRVPRSDIWQGLQNGDYDIGATSPMHHPDSFPMTQAFELPAFKNDSAYVASMAFMEAWGNSTALYGEYTAQNLAVMHFWTSGPYAFLMVPGKNVTQLADFPDKLIACNSTTQVECIEALGAEARSMSKALFAEELDDGLVDGVLGIPEDLRAYGLGAYIGSATRAPFISNTVYMTVMNMDSFDQMPPSVRVLFLVVSLEAPEYFGKLTTWANADGLTLVPHVYDLPGANATEYQLWIDACANITAAWVDGDPERQAMLDHAVWHDARASDEYGDWTPGATPPPSPW